MELLGESVQKGLKKTDIRCTIYTVLFCGSDIHAIGPFGDLSAGLHTGGPPLEGAFFLPADRLRHSRCRTENAQKGET